MQEKIEMNHIICCLSKDKAMYKPGDPVTLTIEIESGIRGIQEGLVQIVVKHLETEIGSPLERPFNLQKKDQFIATVELDLPMDDFKGYLVDVSIYDGGNIVAEETIGIDVSSTWVKFPRYGYVWDFRENVDTTRRINYLKDHHINAIQYYDWKYRHHQPVAPELDVWDDWSGRKISAETIRKYIADAKKYNIVSMAYNMIYATTKGYEKDGVKQEWALYFADDNPRGEGHFMFKMSENSPTGINHLYFFDPSNKEWQAYLFEQQNKVFDHFNFDGWHGDTVGEWGKMKTSDGRELYVKDTYTEFLNAAKKAIGDKFLSFNPVGAQGIENVNISDVDVLYAEIWPWDRDQDGELYDSYYSLKKQIERSRKESGGKSLVVPAYMCYEYGEENPGATFNTAAVVLTSSTVYAAGGSKIELGDDEKMLSHEYFPAQHLEMNEELKRRMKKLYDFIVAYENLLRDGQVETDNTIEISDYPTSIKGDPEAIWTFCKQDEQYEIIQMINLLGVSTNDWRASHGEKETPTKVSDVKVTYYYTHPIKEVYMASPDVEGGRTKQLTFTKGENDYGPYIEFTVPSLEYWNMVYMKY